MVFSYLPLGVIGVSLTAALLTECLLWFFVYSTKQFKTFKANIEKHSKKVETAEASGSSNKGAKKKKDKLDAWREEAGKDVVANNFKSGAIVSPAPPLQRRRDAVMRCPRPPTPSPSAGSLQAMVAMLITFRVVSKLFSGVPVARLPFHPPPFLQKVTHRGLVGAEPLECSAVSRPRRAPCAG